MPDGRMLSKSIAWSEQVGSVSFEADYLFMRMLPHLDAAGRLVGSPKAIKAMCCPLRDEVTPEGVERALRELYAVGLIVWYAVDGQNYIEFPGFVAHQRGARLDRESPSRIPPPSGVAPNVVRSTSGSGTEHVRASEVKLSEVKRSEVHVTSASDVTLVDDGAPPPEPPPPPPPSPEPAPRYARQEYSVEFEEFWAAYPADARGTKKTTGKAYNARIRDGHPHAAIMAGLARYKPFLAATGRYPKLAATFVGPDLHFLEPWAIPRAALSSAETPQQRADRVEAERKARISKVQGRKSQRDGEEWWERIQREAGDHGITKPGDVYDYAYKQLAS